MVNDLKFGEMLSEFLVRAAKDAAELPTDDYQDIVNNVDITYDDADNLYLNTILKHVTHFKQKIPAPIRDFADAGLDFLRSNLTGIDEYKKIAHLSSLNSHPKEKFARLMLEGVFKEATNTSRLMSLLTITAVLPHGVAAIMTPVAAFALAAGAWGATAFAAVRVARAVKKYRDPNIWLAHNLVKIDKLDHKLKQLHTEQDQLSAQLKFHNVNSKLAETLKLKRKVAKLKKEIHALEHKRHGLKRNALTIGQVKFISAKKLIPTHLQGKWDKLMSEPTENYTPDQQSHLMKELEKNQREIIANRTVEMVSMATTAVGLTLMAAAPFCAVAAPAVMAAGITIMALGVAIQVGHVLIHKLIHHKAMSHKYSELRHQLYDVESKKFDTTNTEINSPKLQLRYQLVFEYDQSRQNKSTANPGLTKDVWLKKLNDLSPRDKKKYLEIREAKMLNDLIVREALKIDPDKPLPALTDKAKTQIIHRHCRKNWKANLKQCFFAKLKAPSTEQNALEMDTIKPAMR